MRSYVMVSGRIQGIIPQNWQGHIHTLHTVGAWMQLVAPNKS
jgi:hypothetical protein